MGCASIGQACATARALLAQAAEAEVAALLGRHADDLTKSAPPMPAQSPRRFCCLANASGSALQHDSGRSGSARNAASIGATAI
jgi:hypothetical protein